MSTAEQREALATMRAAVPETYRVTRDTEGFPIVPGRKHGRTDDAVGRGRDRLDWIGGRGHFFGCYVASRTRRGLGIKLKALLALPGVRRHQVGDFEARLFVTAEAIPAVLPVIRAQRTRRPGGRPFPSRAARVEGGSGPISPAISPEEAS